jgi:hypothetical protein
MSDRIMARKVSLDCKDRFNCTNQRSSSIRTDAQASLLRDGCTCCIGKKANRISGVLQCSCIQRRHCVPITSLGVKCASGYKVTLCKRHNLNQRSKEISQSSDTACMLPLRILVLRFWNSLTFEACLQQFLLDSRTCEIS